jgi:hypothetical protein
VNVFDALNQTISHNQALAACAQLSGQEREDREDLARGTRGRDPYCMTIQASKVQTTKQKFGCLVLTPSKNGEALRDAMIMCTSLYVDVPLERV